MTGKQPLTLEEAVRTIYTVSHPELEAQNAQSMIRAFNNPISNLDMKQTTRRENVDSIWNLIEVLQQYDKPKSDKKLKRPMDDYNDGLGTFLELGHGGSVEEWVMGKVQKVQEANLYRGAGFFAHGLLLQADCRSYVGQALRRLGIHEQGETLYDDARLHRWERELVLLVTYILLGASRGDAWVQEKRQLLNRHIDENSTATQAILLAEQGWLPDAEEFRPRTMEDSRNRLYLKDFYVYPDFSCAGKPSAGAVWRMEQSGKGTKQLIISQTGMGKTMYMRMASLCMSRSRLPEPEALADMAEQIGAKSSRYVLYVPAYMFTYCWQRPEYRSWTSDFVTLYFQSMFQLSNGVNFDKRSERQTLRDTDMKDCALNDELLTYVRGLAETGRLVLMADSFDEILPGEMRTRYLAAISAFRKQYCEMGAHMLVTSREMSPDTMSDLANALGIRLQSEQVYHICPLTKQQQEQLIRNWDRYAETGAGGNLKLLENHFYTELGSNPYMLSMMCRYGGAKLNTIFEKLIDDTLNQRILPAADAMENDLLRSVLQSAQIRRILQGVALNTFQTGTPHFPLTMMAAHCRESLSDLELSDDEFDDCFQMMLELFTIAAGLIVPADGEDDRFQFITPQLRYELAAAKLEGDALRKKDAEGECVEMVSSLRDDRTFIDLSVTLICRTTSVSLAESLVQRLVLRSFAPENSWLFDRALTDLVLRRYGPNITCVNPNPNDRAYAYHLRADRMVMMRLLSSPTFCPTEAEQHALMECNAMKGCAGFLNDLQLAGLAGK